MSFKSINYDNNRRLVIFPPCPGIAESPKRPSTPGSGVISQVPVLPERPLRRALTEILQSDPRPAPRPPPFPCRGTPPGQRLGAVLPWAHPPGAARRGAGRAAGSGPGTAGARDSLGCHGTGDAASCPASGGPSLTPGSSPPPRLSQGPTGCWQRAAPARPPAAARPRPEAPPPAARGPARPGSRSAARSAPPAQPLPPRPARAGGRPSEPGPPRSPPEALATLRWRGPRPRQPGTKWFVFPRGAKATVKSAPESDAKQLPKPQPSCVSSASNSRYTATNLLAHRVGL